MSDKPLRASEGGELLPPKSTVPVLVSEAPAPSAGAGCTGVVAGTQSSPWEVDSSNQVSSRTRGRFAPAWVPDPPPPLVGIVVVVEPVLGTEVEVLGTVVVVEPVLGTVVVVEPVLGTEVEVLGTVVVVEPVLGTVVVVDEDGLAPPGAPEPPVPVVPVPEVVGIDEVEEVEELDPGLAPDGVVCSRLALDT
ncbi:MAG: hypothetical protein M0T80_09140, partial [Actinomycetota bacterium]|nr:hypothetical protein [Actinomycetota bacterium]